MDDQIQHATHIVVSVVKCVKSSFVVNKSGEIRCSLLLVIRKPRLPRTSWLWNLLEFYVKTWPNLPFARNTTRLNANQVSISNQIFNYTRCKTSKRVTSWQGPFRRHCARAKQFFLKKGAGMPFRYLSRECFSA